MTTSYGYISDYGSISEMPLKDLETAIIDLNKDSRINEWDKRKLLHGYMSARWDKLQRSFEYTAENVRLLDRANELLKASAESVARKAWRTYQAELENLKAHPCRTFNCVSVEAHLHVPFSFVTDNAGHLLIAGNVDETLWDALASFCRLELSGGIMLPGRLSPYCDRYDSEDDFVCEVLWSLPYDEDPKKRNWGHDCMMDIEATEGICFS